MTTLKEAIETGNLAKFVKEHKRDPKGDATATEKVIRSMAGKSKATPKASSRGGSDD